MSILIPRSQMPQIDEEFIPQLIVFLGVNGVIVEGSGYCHPDHLTPHQSVGEYNLSRFASNPELWRKPCLIASDTGILDGNHRHHGHRLMGSRVPFIRFSMPFYQGVALLNAFPFAYNVEND